MADEEGRTAGAATLTFANLGVKPWLVKGLQALHIMFPTPIQQKCIGSILSGDDVIGMAKTGSGKTAAFALPILQKLAEDPFGVYGLILTPTRELASQIAEQFQVLGKTLNVRVCTIVGGMDMIAQSLELAKRPHIVVATPGRLADHFKSTAGCTQYFRNMNFLVLDEADRLLEATFSSELDTILSHIPTKRQTLLFSATMTSNIEKLSTMSLRNPLIFEVDAKYDMAEKLKQHYVLIPTKVKPCCLTYLLRNDFEGKTVIIFVGTCKTGAKLNTMLRELNIRCTALHSQMSQKERFASLAKFKSGVVNILIATDVASRGLDIPTVAVVINYDIPGAPRDYVHRVGRTARAGRGGLSLSIVTERDIELIKAIEGKIEKQLGEYAIEENNFIKLLNEVSVAERTATMSLVDSKFEEKKERNLKKLKLQEGEEEATSGKPQKQNRKRFITSTDESKGNGTAKKRKKR